MKVIRTERVTAGSGKSSGESVSTRSRPDVGYLSVMSNSRCWFEILIIGGCITTSDGGGKGGKGG